MMKIIILTVVGLSLICGFVYEGLRVKDAQMELATFQERELTKIKGLITHPRTGERDDVSPLIESIVADGDISAQEYQWLAGAMVHRFKNIGPDIAAGMLDAGYQTTAQLALERQQLETMTQPLVWLTQK